jgi:hypothetical protein
MMRPRVLSRRDLATVGRLRKRYGAPITPAGFGAWLLSELASHESRCCVRPSKSGRPKIFQSRQHVLIALYWIRYWSKPCRIRSAARDILRVCDISITTPRKIGEETSRSIKSLPALESEISGGLKHCSGYPVAWIINQMLLWREESESADLKDLTLSVEFLPKPPNGTLSELVSVTPKQPAILFQWIDTVTTKFNWKIVPE